jgi:hypothetical protein
VPNWLSPAQLLGQEYIVADRKKSVPLISGNAALDR